jgi:DNA-binding beta-propeller fold protein YncE
MENISMKFAIRSSFTFAALAACAVSLGQGYTTRVIARHLASPMGIEVAGFGPFKTVFFTEVPTPGIPGSSGGHNKVRLFSLFTGGFSTISEGEPEPLNLSLDRQANLYWTCKSAGVILCRDARTREISPLLTGLRKPTGIDVDSFGQIYFTQVPTPTVGGGGGGMNTVDVFTPAGSVFNLTRGEPEPTDIVVDSEGTAYWTCKSAGVILMRTRFGMVSVVLANLPSPTGIALNHQENRLFWTEVPTPGVGGGKNAVRVLNLDTNAVSTVNMGDPEPTDVAVARDGRVYWTCTSAGVIVEARRTH